MTPPILLEQSYCYIADNPQHRVLLREWGMDYSLPCWVPQQEISWALFGDEGLKNVQACEAQYGPFVWATEFANVHSTFHCEPCPILIDNEVYAGAEQYYQAMKSYGNSDHQTAKDAIRMSTPLGAWSLGQQYSIREDWKHVSVSIMMKAIHAKFTQDSELKRLLMSTGECKLVQIKPSDDFWGTGPHHNGQNMLGMLLEELRTELLTSSVVL